MRLLAVNLQDSKLEKPLKATKATIAVQVKGNDINRLINTLKVYALLLTLPYFSSFNQSLIKIANVVFLILYCPPNTIYCAFIRCTPYPDDSIRTSH